MAVVGIRNFDRLEKRLLKLKDGLSGKILDDAMDAAAQHLRQAIQSATPIRTGRARASVIVYASTRQRKFGEVRKLVGYSKDAFYMFFREVGVRGQPARPTVGLVFNSQIKGAMEKAYAVMRAGIRKAIA